MVVEQKGKFKKATPPDQPRNLETFVGRLSMKSSTVLFTEDKAVLSVFSVNGAQFSTECRKTKTKVR